MPVALPSGDTRLKVRPNVLHDWDPKYIIPAKEESLDSAKCCGNCSIYWCGMSFLSPGVGRAGCAAGTNWALVHSYMRDGDWSTAYKRLVESNPFPGFMVTCNADCMNNCSMKHNSPHAVAIQANEAALSNWAREKGLITPRRIPPSTGKRVLVVGGGISGMTAAYYLRGEGHDVTVADSGGEWFGLIATAVPFFKQDKSWIELYHRNLVSEGVQFLSRTRVGTGAMPLTAVFTDFDAIVLAVGAHQHNPLGNVPGADRDWVTPAVQMLFDQNWEFNSGGTHPNPLRSEQFDIAIVVGAGETADDAVHTIRRLKRDVRIVQLIRRAVPELTQGDPKWPNAAPYLFKVLNEDDHVSEKLWDTVITQIDGTREAGTVHLRSGSEKLPPLHGRIRIFYATGFSGPVQSGLLAQLQSYGLKLDRQGRVVVNDYFQTGIYERPVFGAGDAVIGMSDFVKALAVGREAAHGADRYLREGESEIPSLHHPPKG